MSFKSILFSTNIIPLCEKAIEPWYIKMCFCASEDEKYFHYSRGRNINNSRHIQRYILKQIWAFYVMFKYFLPKSVCFAILAVGLQNVVVWEATTLGARLLYWCLGHPTAVLVFGWGHHLTSNDQACAHYRWMDIQSVNTGPSKLKQ